MNLRWFRLKGMIFLPASLAGWLVSIAALAYAVYAFIDIDSHSHSVSDTLVNFVFILIIVGAVYTVIAYFTCRPMEPE
jgi:membrane protein DedA with SNARE-associated domain